MSVGYVLDEVSETHRAPAGHPERPQRLVATRDALSSLGISEWGVRLPTRAATEAQLGRIHTAAYISELSRLLPNRSGWLDADTFYSPGTWNAVLAAAGGAVDVTKSVLAGAHQTGLVIARPPGHHAEADRAMGFCIYNNVAIAAAAARAAGAGRVAIVDWDVHHGNGTQNSFYDDPNVLFMSVHQYPFYPGTGSPTEIGRGPGRGSTVNVGLPAGAGDLEYLAVFEEIFVPRLQAFSPDLILLSAGFDAHQADPLANMNLSSGGFAQLARQIHAVAASVCEGRVVAIMEGGYDLEGLAGGVSAMAEVLAGLPPSAAGREGSGRALMPAARKAIDATKAAHAST